MLLTYEPDKRLLIVDYRCWQMHVGKIGNQILKTIPDAGFSDIYFLPFPISRIAS